MHLCQVVMLDPSPPKNVPLLAGETNDSGPVLVHAGVGGSSSSPRTSWEQPQSSPEGRSRRGSVPILESPIPILEDGLGKKSSVAGASANFINSIIGAGIIGLPYATKQCGFIFGIMVMVMVAAVTAYTVDLLIRTGLKVNCRTYEGVCEHAMGRWGYFTVSWFIFLGSFGAQVAYLIVLGDTATPVLASWLGAESILADRQFIVCMSAVLFMLPLFLQRDLSSFAATSSLSLVAVALIVIMVTARAPAAAQEQGIVASSESYKFIDSHLFSGIGTMSFAFVCHQGAFIVLDSLDNPTVERWNTVTNISVAAALVVSLILVLVGFCNFLDSTDADILNNFSQDDSAINVARLLLAFTMILTYPVNAFVTRYSLHVIMYKGQEVSKKEHYVSTLVLFATSLVLGALLETLGPVMAFVGALTSCSVGYVLPVMCYFGVEGYRAQWDTFWAAWFGGAMDTTHLQDSLQHSEVEEEVYRCSRCLDRRRAASCGQFVVPMLVLVFGLISMVVGSIDALAS